MLSERVITWLRDTERCSRDIIEPVGSDETGDEFVGLEVAESSDDMVSDANGRNQKIAAMKKL